MKSRSKFRLGAAILVIIAGISAGSTSAAAATLTAHAQEATATASVVHPLYVAGTAHAYALSFTTSGSTAHYHCSFSGWAAVQVDYSCSVYDSEGSRVAEHTGHFTGPSHTTSTYTFNDPLTNCYYTQATGSYSDGSASASNKSACV